MKKKLCTAVIISSVLLSLSAPCRSDASTGLEKLVLCSDEQVAKEAKEMVENGNGFKSTDGNFYEPVQKTQAFGFEVAYVGLAGVDMVPGPNITVRGKFGDVEKKVKDAHHGKFECGDGGCDSEVDKHWHVLIYPHPVDQELTIIQCGYFGP